MSDVKIVLEAVDNASKQIGKVNQEVSKLGGSTKDLKTATDKAVAPIKDFRAALGNIAMVAGTAGVAFAGLKKAFDLGREGAQLDYAAGKFDRLAASIGTTSDALLRDLKDATRGTVSDMELMAGAGDFLALGLAKTHDEAVRLTRVAGGLGMNMNQLVLTLTNQTTMRFDALGVSVDGFKERVDALKKSGMDANAAFTEAFLQQAEAQLEKVGDIADTDAGKFMRLDAATKNLSDTFKRRLAPAAADVAEGLTRLLMSSEDRLRAFHREADASKTLALSEKEYEEQLHKIATANLLIINAEGDLIDNRGNLIEKNVLLTKGQRELMYIVQNSREPWEEMTDAERKAAEAAAEAAKETADLKSKLDELKLFMAGPLGKEIENFNKKQGDLRDKQQEIIDKIHELNGKSYLTGEQRQELEDLKGEYEEVRQDILDNAAAHEEATRRILFDLLQQKLAMDGVIDEDDFNTLNELAWHWGLIDDATYEAWQEMSKYVDQMEDGTIKAGDLAAKIAGIPTHKKITLTIEEQRIISEATYLRERQGSGRQEATGGLVYAGQPYIVGEAGREPFVPNVDGRIISNSEFEQILRNISGGGGGGTTINVYPTVSGPLDVYQMAYQLKEVLEQIS